MSDSEGETVRLTLDIIRTPYDENEIVRLVTELYELLIKLAYLGRDHITWPSSGGHAINEDLCRELQIEHEVVSLMKRLPYVDGDFRYSIHLFPQSEPLLYLQDDDVERSRDPDGEPRRLRRDYILPHDVRDAVGDVELEACAVGLDARVECDEPGHGDVVFCLDGVARAAAADRYHS